MPALDKTQTGPVAMVEAIRGSLGASYEWDEREAALLDLAVRQAANLERLEADIDESGVRSPAGGVSTVVSEARQSRVALARILGQIDIPRSEKPSITYARKAADARWKRAG